jgi:hypothetical protein
MINGAVRPGPLEQRVRRHWHPQIMVLRISCCQIMHRFDDLVTFGTDFSLDALARANESVFKGLRQHSSTHGTVVALQMLRLQLAISAVGMFAMFDARLQDCLVCASGFRAANEMLELGGERDLGRRFENYQLAVNVLKHGRGRSYDTLVERSNDLPFRLLLPSESFFEEGDVSEVSTLVEVNDEFVRQCAVLIHEVSTVLRRIRPDLIL